MDNKAQRNKVSLHEVKVFRALQGSPDKWLTNKDVAAASGVAERTTRLHTRRQVRLGLLEQVEVFPANRYRWSGEAAKRNAAYVQRLEQAASVFGV